ncbi:hypothetical protein MBLNU457_g2955t2 [Dothideomycetes sp. NU457]
MAVSHFNERHIELARSLPPRLLAFFKKYPPKTGSSAITNNESSTTENVASIAENTSTSISPSSEATTPDSNDQPLTRTTILDPPNPFLPFKHPLSNHWHPPVFSMRRQAEIIKLAKEHNVVSLLPYSPKLPSEVERRRRENGLRVRGTGVGQKVKGKLWERTLSGRLEQRTKAMEGMAELIKNWKQRGHGRGLKKWPK